MNESGNIIIPLFTNNVYYFNTSTKNIISEQIIKNIKIIAKKYLFNLYKTNTFNLTSFENTHTLTQDYIDFKNNFTHYLIYTNDNKQNHTLITRDNNIVQKYIKYKTKYLKLKQKL